MHFLLRASRSIERRFLNLSYTRWYGSTTLPVPYSPLSYFCYHGPLVRVSCAHLELLFVHLCTFSYVQVLFVFALDDTVVLRKSTKMAVVFSWLRLDSA